MTAGALVLCGCGDVKIDIVICPVCLCLHSLSVSTELGLWCGLRLVLRPHRYSCGPEAPPQPLLLYCDLYSNLDIHQQSNELFILTEGRMRSTKIIFFKVCLSSLYFRSTLPIYLLPLAALSWCPSSRSHSHSFWFSCFADSQNLHFWSFWRRK